MRVKRKFFDINDKRTREKPRVTKKTPLNYDGIVEVNGLIPFSSTKIYQGVSSITRLTPFCCVTKCRTLHVARQTV